MAKSNTVPPYPLAMVVCDAIWRDPASGKSTILGTFSAITGSDFPLTLPEIAVYVALTDGHGTINLKLQLVDVNEEHEPLNFAEGELDFDDPRSVAELAFHLTNITFPEPGEYRFQLYSASELLMERRILIMDSTENTEEV